MMPVPRNIVYMYEAGMSLIAILLPSWSVRQIVISAEQTKLEKDSKGLLDEYSLFGRVRQLILSSSIVAFLDSRIIP